MHWIEQITRATTGDTRYSTPVAQAIVRGSTETAFHVSRLRENPPSILIGTPQAILDIWQEDEHAIKISSLGSVVVDEVDYIIDFIPADASKDRKQKLVAKMRRHPSAAKLLLDRIYAPRIRPDGSAAVDGSPQLVVCSATLPTGLRQQLYQNGWFKKGTETVIKVRSEMPVGITPESDKNVAGIGPEPQMEHYALIFSEDGSVRDVEGAVESMRSSEGEEANQRQMQTSTDLQGSDLPDIPAELAESEFEVSHSARLWN
jgi:DEAD/DEAH box helicase